MFSEITDRLIQASSTGELGDEILQAREEYFSGVKDINSEESFYDERMNAFLEWYCIERPVGKTGKTPLAIFLANMEKSIGTNEKLFLEALGLSIHSTFRLKRISEKTATLIDLFTNAVHETTDTGNSKNIGMNVVFEARLIPYNGSNVYGRTFLVHPREAKGAILQEIRRAKKERRLDAAAFMQHLSTLWIRQARYKGVITGVIYSKEELSKPNTSIL